MSKVYLEALYKSKSLTEGLRRNQDLAQKAGINMKEVNKLESMVDEGEKLNEQLENMRNEISKMVVKANTQLREIKDLTIRLKRSIKCRYDISYWKELGVLDKR